MEGWIKLHRGLLDWEWYDDPKVFRLFIHCLLKANYEDKDWRGTKIFRGSFVTSLQKLSCETKLSVKEIRTILGKLKGKELAIKSSSQNTVIQVVRYDEYQSGANEGQTNGQTKGNQRATTKNIKNKKNKEEFDLSGFEKDKIHIIESWIEYRKEIKKRLTQKSLDTISKKFKTHSVASCEFVVNNSISNGWTGLFWDKVSEIQENNNNFKLNLDKL
jgi:hypothetical protein